MFGIADDYDDLPGSLEVKVDRELIDDFLKDLEKHEKALRESRELLEKSRDMKKPAQCMKQLLIIITAT